MLIRHPHRSIGLTAIGLLLAASTALAANGIDITRGVDSTVYGNCVPSLEVDR